MTVLLKDIGSALISSLLSKYINNLDSEQLNIALSKGELSLSDVTVRETALSDHHLPFRVICSRIGTINIKVPFRYTTTPAVIEVDDVQVLLSVSGNVIIESDLSSKVKTKPTAENKAKERGFMGKMFYSVMEQVISNLKCTFSSVYRHVIFDEPASGTSR